MQPAVEDTAFERKIVPPQFQFLGGYAVFGVVLGYLMSIGGCFGLVPDLRDPGLPIGSAVAFLGGLVLIVGGHLLLILLKIAAKLWHISPRP